MRMLTAMDWVACYFRSQWTAQASRILLTYPYSSRKGVCPDWEGVPGHGLGLWEVRAVPGGLRVVHCTDWPQTTCRTRQHQGYTEDSAEVSASLNTTWQQSTHQARTWWSLMPCPEVRWTGRAAAIYNRMFKAMSSRSHRHGLHLTRSWARYVKRHRKTWTWRQQWSTR